MKIIYRTLILCLFIFAGCKGKVGNGSMMRNESEINRVIGYIGTRQAFPPSDYVPIDIEIYELREKYYPMLDSIILRSINYPKNRARKLGFSISVRDEIGEHQGRISILLVNHWELDVYALRQAVFYYKGFQFNYFGDFFEDMVEKKETRTLYRVNPDLFDFGMRDDRYYGSWGFLIKDGNVIFEDSFMSKKWD